MTNTTTALQNCPICGKIPKVHDDVNGWTHIYCKEHWWSKQYHHHIVAYHTLDAVQKWNKDAEDIKSKIDLYHSLTEPAYGKQ